MEKPTTVEEYCAAKSGAAGEMVAQLRALSREAAPEAVEALKWSSPAYLHPSGAILFVFSAHREHANFMFTTSTREAFADELTGFTTGQGRVQLPYGEPVPRDLLQRMIAYRLREFEDGGVRWK